MRKRAKSLRRTLTIVAIVGTGLALALAALLITLSTIMQRSTTVLSNAMDSVLIAEAAEVDLFLHENAHDPIVRRHLESTLLHKIERAQQHVSTPGEAQVYALVASNVNAYFIASNRGESVELAHAGAYQALERLASINLTQAREAKQGVEMWERLAQQVALAVAGSLIVIAGLLIVWVRRRAFQPVFSLAEVMQRFARGERDARADERGPVELKLMSERFNQMADAIAAQRQAQIAFLAGVAHDLRNPLGALKFALSAVGDLEHGIAMERPLEIANRQISRLDRMVADFLDSAKIDAGQLELRCQVLDARACVTEVVDQLRSATDKHELVVTLPAQRVPISCDPLRLEQVLSNLVSNAIKYAPEGGTIHLSVESSEAYAFVSVTDPGIGISAEDQTRLFEPFRRVGLSKGAFPGMGLGLYVVRRIVEAHAGRIEVRSTPGTGSTFTVVLPLAVGAREAARDDGAVVANFAHDH